MSYLVSIFSRKISGRCSLHVCFILSLLINFAELLILPIKSLSLQRLGISSFQELFSEDKRLIVSLILRKYLLLFCSLKVDHISEINHGQEGLYDYSQFNLLQASICTWDGFSEAKIITKQWSKSKGTFPVDGSKEDEC